MILQRRLTCLTAAPLLFAVFLASSQLQANVTGKVSGVVVNAETGEPVAGATVSVAATNLATKADDDGEYFIIGVPVGEFDLVVTHVGFERMAKKNVRVLADLTTPVDFEIKVATVELSNEVVVYAQAPLIQKDLTASRVIFTEERLRNLPNITSVQAILTNYPGVVTDDNNQLHVRGGRAGQLSYYYDGFSIQDPFFATAGMRIVPTALAELSLTSGGFSAEYGEALSGVVSAVTKEGTAEYHGGLRVFQGATHPYDVNTGKWGSLRSINNRALATDISGPIPGLNERRYNFFASGEYLTDQGYLPHNWSTTYTGLCKLTMQPASRWKLKTNVTVQEADGALYTHRDVNNVSYDFNLDGLPVWDQSAYLAGLTSNYALSERVITSLTFNQYSTKRQSGPSHLKGVYWSNWPGYKEDQNGIYDGTIDDDNYRGDIDWTDPLQVTGFTVGDDFEPTYAFRQTRYNSLAGNLTAQWNKNNQIKAGFEYRRYHVEWDKKQFYNDQPYGEKYSSRPRHTSLYIEDKMEYRDYVINLGLRYDYRNSDISFNYTPEAEVAHYREADSKSRFSPRLGVSFPISDLSAMHFNYGIYYQEPQYSYLYTNLQGDRSSGLPILGNPNLEPEETISYELGVDHMVGENLRVDLTAYCKDVADLVTSREAGLVGGNPVTKYVNGDYGTVTGFDLSLERLPVDGYLSGSISYGFMIAKGNGSTANEAYYTYLTSNTDTLPPLSQFPLDFDQRHTITAVLDLRIPEKWNGRFLGLKLPGAWGVSMVGYFGSGLPYTRTDASGNRLGERNDNRMPAVYSVDVRFNKDLTVGRPGDKLTFFMEVDNLFNRRNVLDVYTRSGLPDNDLNIIGTGLSLDENELNEYDRLFDHDPQNFSPPRTIRTGLEFTF
jgi:outer membrane receptor protein involved in Fe transport